MRSRVNTTVQAILDAEQIVDRQGWARRIAGAGGPGPLLANVWNCDPGAPRPTHRHGGGSD